MDRDPVVDGAETRFVEAADGTCIAYRVRGEGPPLVLCNGLTTSDFFWRYVLPRWTERRRVVTWDYKGHGDSGPAKDLAAATIEASVDDLKRVLDAADVSSAPVVGFSMGSQVALEACRQLPDRVAAAACVLGPAGRLFDTALPPITGPAVQRLLILMGARATPVVMASFGRILGLPPTTPTGKLLGLVGRDTPREDLAIFARHFARMHHPTVRALALAGGRHDASDVLPALSVPLLIVAGDRDPFAPARTVGARMHQLAPSSVFHRMRHGSHTSLLEHPTEIALVVEDFLDRAMASPTHAACRPE